MLLHRHLVRADGSELSLRNFLCVKNRIFLDYFHFLALFILKSPYDFHVFHSRKGKNKGKLPQLVYCSNR